MSWTFYYRDSYYLSLLPTTGLKLSIYYMKMEIRFWKLGFFIEAEGQPNTNYYYSKSIFSNLRSWALFLLYRIASFVNLSIVGFQEITRDFSYFFPSILMISSVNLSPSMQHEARSPSKKFNSISEFLSKLQERSKSNKTCLAEKGISFDFFNSLLSLYISILTLLRWELVSNQQIENPPKLRMRFTLGISFPRPLTRTTWRLILSYPGSLQMKVILPGCGSLAIEMTISQISSELASMGISPSEECQELLSKSAYFSSQRLMEFMIISPRFLQRESPGPFMGSALRAISMRRLALWLTLSSLVFSDLSMAIYEA